LHTIVRLPNGVFNPYTGIRTNLLFFDKGKPTKEIWYFEHPLPKGYKTYNKGKPIQIKEFDLEKEWWKDRENKKFVNNCWKVSIEEIQKTNYNLDINNPNGKEEEEGLSSKEILEKLEESFDASRKLIEKIKGEV
jgi:type I restriction enzyme M protein